MQSAQPQIGKRHWYPAILWLLILCLCATFCAYRVIYSKPFYNNLLELLPKDERNPVLHDLSRLLANRFQDRLVILIHNDNEEHALKKAKSLQHNLLQSPLLKADNNISNIQQELKSLYQPFSQQLLSRETRQWLQQSPAAIAEQSLIELLSPVASPRPYPFNEDPFNLGGRWLNKLLPNIALGQKDGLPFVKSQTGNWFMVAAQLQGSPFDLDVQKAISQKLSTFKTTNPDIKVLTSGMIFHAAAGTEQAQHEITSVGLGSLIGIVLLVWIVFRSTKPLLSILFILGSSCLVALSVSLLVFDRIHIITLAFGSTLLGVAVDYAFHFIIKTHKLGCSLRARQAIKYAIIIGALSSISAYLLQLSTPFPGLQQMAVFSATGLAGACLSVFFFGPFYRNPTHNKITAWLSLFEANVSPLYRKIKDKPLLSPLISFTLIIASVGSIYHFGNNDNIANLNTSTEELLSSEKQVQQLLQQPSSNRFFFIEADTEQRLLQKLEGLRKEITQNSTFDYNYQSIERFIPSHQQQSKDKALAEEKLFSRNGALTILCQKINIDCKMLRRKENQSLAREALSPQDFSATNASKILPPIMSDNKSWQTLLTLNTNISDLPRLERIARKIPGVRFVDQTQNLSDLLGRYRKSITTVLSITIALLFLCLILRYRLNCWRIALPLTLSLSIALGMAAASGGITVFHLMALLLVLGIGIDTAVFYLEVGFQGDSWLAATLASFTSILAFGLLALSNIPVLHQFGLIVLTGIFSCWLLTPLFHNISANRV